MRQNVLYLIQIILMMAIVLFTMPAVMAQPDHLSDSTQQQTAIESYFPKPRTKPNQEFSSRTMQRTGTAIVGARNSVSIKSTDAGIIHYPPAVPATPYPHYAPNQPHVPSVSGCINCGIIDYISIVGQGNALGTIASGIVAGTIARQIGGYGTYSHPNQDHGEHTEHRGQQHYHVGITMHDGSQQVITVPDVSHLHHGDRIQLIDGMILPEHMGK